MTDQEYTIEYFNKLVDEELDKIKKCIHQLLNNYPIYMFNMTKYIYLEVIQY